MNGEQVYDRWLTAGLDDLLDGMSRIEFTLRFKLSNPDTTIAGPKNLGHLGNNIQSALKGPLPADVLAFAKHRIAATPISNTEN